MSGIAGAFRDFARAADRLADAVDKLETAISDAQGTGDDAQFTLEKLIAKLDELGVVRKDDIP